MNYQQLQAIVKQANLIKPSLPNKIDVCINTFIKPGRAWLRPQIDPMSKRVYGIAFDVCPAVHKQLLACKNNRDNGEEFNRILQGLAIDVMPNFEGLTGICLTIPFNEPQQCQ